MRGGGATYYNEHDQYAVAWLRNLIAAGHLPAGDVDDRDIRDIRPADLAGYTQCHFFAGIGGWPLALRMAGWDDARPVWTGSCPCQPFSAAGKRKGAADERHLWPEFHRLIAERRPPSVFGEQVASKDGRLWLAGVRADLEALGYAVGAADLCAAGIGAPHIRQRLFWVADADGGFAGDRDIQPGGEYGQQPQDRGIGGRLADSDEGQRGRLANGEECQRDREAAGWAEGDRQPEPGGADGGLADATSEYRRGRTGGDNRPEVGDGRPTGRLADAERRAAERHGYALAGTPGCDQSGKEERQWLRADARDGGNVGRMGHAEGDGREQWRAEPSGRGASGGRGEGFWSAAEWLSCADGKARRAEPGIFPLAHGVPNRVGRLRAYGNAIVPQVAVEFVSAFVQARAAA